MLKFYKVVGTKKFLVIGVLLSTPILIWSSLDQTPIALWSRLQYAFSTLFTIFRGFFFGFLRKNMILGNLPNNKKMEEDMTKMEISHTSMCMGQR